MSDQQGGESLPPDWAFDRVKQILDSEYGAGWYMRAMPSGGAKAFARYIAEHEEAPVDPLLIEAREIVASWYEAHPDKVYNSNTPEKIRSGEYDDRPETEQALAALRRGIELARQPQSLESTS